MKPSEEQSARFGDAIISDKVLLIPGDVSGAVTRRGWLLHGIECGQMQDIHANSPYFFRSFNNSLPPISKPKDTFRAPVGQVLTQVWHKIHSVDRTRKSILT